MSDYPFEECTQAAGELLEKGGVAVFQKFTCDGCGQRLMVDEPNKFFTHGSCDQCSAITDITKKGCNYLLHAHKSFPASQLTLCITPDT